MTVLEALNVEVNNQVLSNKYLVFVGLDITSVYDAANNDTVDLAKAYCFKSLATQPDFSEDGLSVKYTRSYLISEANRIFGLNGLEDELIGGTPSISNKTGIW